MSALADQATKQINELVERFKKAGEELRTAKARTQDPEARMALTNLQTTMFGLGADVGMLKATLRAVRMTGYFNVPTEHVSAPVPDRRLLAAGDHTFEEDQ